VRRRHRFTPTLERAISRWQPWTDRNTLPSSPSEARRDQDHRIVVSSAQHLAQMANDIGHFYRGEPNRADAIAGIANHIKSYWTRRMREKLMSQLSDGEVVVDELPGEALRKLAEHPSAKPTQPMGGDAG
jgi:formate dehydrogenase subunit delta